MATVPDENVFNLAVKGTFDDCQDIVKSLFGDSAFNSTYRLGAINSINWARILAQTGYYFSSYFALLKLLQLTPAQATERGILFQYAVPTGNFGDILAGWYAHRLGLPMTQFILATNANDILERFWRTGRYEKSDSSPTPTTPQTAAAHGSSDGAQTGVHETLSPAMDIVVSSNFERLLWHLAFETLTSGAVASDGEVDGGAHARLLLAGEILSGWMKDLKTKSRAVVKPEVTEAARREFLAERVSDAEVGFSVFDRPIMRLTL